MSKFNKNLNSDFNENAGGNTPQYPVLIETPRLILREIKWNDVDAFHQMTSKPEFKYYCFDGTRAKVEAFVQEAIDTRKPHADGNRTEVMLAVVLRETGELIGHVALQRVNYVKGYDFDANFFIDPAHQGKGYAHEAIVNMKHYGYQEMGIQGYTITVHPQNSASLRVFMSEGYKQIGDTKLKTVFGEEPRVLLFQSKAEFYERRKSDKRTMLLPPKPAANQNDKKPGGPKVG